MEGTPPVTYSLGHGFYLLFESSGSSSCNAALVLPSGARFLLDDRRGCCSRYVMNAPLMHVMSSMAVAIGLWCGHKLRSSGLKHGESHSGLISSILSLYAVSFFTYALMMGVSAVAEAVMAGLCDRMVDFLQPYVYCMNVTLISCLAASFMFNGLADAGLLDESSKISRVLIPTSYMAIFLAYVYAIFVVPGSVVGYYLYVYGLVITGGLYVACETVYVFWMGRPQGVIYLFIASVLGAAGFGAMLFYPPELCRITAPVIGNQELCFLFINWAMFSISEFFFANHNEGENQEEEGDAIEGGAMEEGAVEMEEKCSLLTADGDLVPVFISRK